MAKTFCVICDEPVGSKRSALQLTDGYVCAACLMEAGIRSVENLYSYDANAMRQLISDRTAMATVYSPTKMYDDYLTVDENHRMFTVHNNIFLYDNLVTYELLEDGDVVTKGGIGQAVVGGLAFSAAGAFIGGVAGKKTSKKICTSMRIRITLKNAYTDTTYINLIESKTKTSSLNYTSKVNIAQSCISALEIILDECSSRKAQVASQSLSVADEILKFKQLLDAGIITQDEFNAKKTQLLGL